MRTSLVLVASILSFACIANAQDKPVAHAAAAPQTKEVVAPEKIQNEILKAQRNLQSTQLNENNRRQQAVEVEQKAEQGADANLKKAIEDLNAQVEKARKDLNLPAGTPFDQIKLAFVVPVK